MKFLCTLVVYCAYSLLLHSRDVNSLNLRPIIGVLAQDSNTGQSWKSFGDTYIRTTYVQFIESAGARAVPIRVKEGEEYYKNIFSKINGILFPGGAQKSLLDSTYGKAGKLFVEMSIEASKKGDVFPVWGTCEGFELLAAVIAGKNPLSSCDSENITLPLQFLKDYKKSSMFQNLPTDLHDITTHYGVTQNYHKYCLTHEELNDNPKLHKFFRVMTTSIDRKGKKFISSFEALKYPIYGVQFHPEKNLFDWDLQLAVNHTEGAIQFTQYLANFFVQQARKSKHHFNSPIEEASMLFQNYKPYYLADPTFHTVYLFNWTQQSTKNSHDSSKGLGAIDKKKIKPTTSKPDQKHLPQDEVKKYPNFRIEEQGPKSKVGKQQPTKSPNDEEHGKKKKKPSSEQLLAASDLNVSVADNTTGEDTVTEFSNRHRLVQMTVVLIIFGAVLMLITLLIIKMVLINAKCHARLNTNRKAFDSFKLNNDGDTPNGCISAVSQTAPLIRNEIGIPNRVVGNHFSNQVVDSNLFSNQVVDSNHYSKVVDSNHFSNQVVDSNHGANANGLQKKSEKSVKSS